VKPLLFPGSSGLLSRGYHTLVLIALILGSSSLNATSWECGERSNLPQEGKNYCAAGDFRQSQINLAKVLERLLEKQLVSFGDTTALTRAQDAFKSYRDNQCIAENRRIEDKPYHPMLVAQCQTRLTNLRIDELKRLQDQLQ